MPRPEPSDEPTTTRLGDWYAHVVWERPRTILCVSEHTFLPLVLPGKKAKTELVPAIVDAVPRALRDVGIDEDAIEAESLAMNEVLVDKTASRRVLGTMNQMKYSLEHMLRDGLSNLEMQRYLYGFVCMSADEHFPDKATRKLFSTPHLRLVR